MCQRTIFSRSCTRIAEQLQLLAEEEWIVSALKNLKHQRNCLQIERLHLESLKVKMSDPVKSNEKKKEVEDLASAISMMKNPGHSWNMNQCMETDAVNTAEDVMCNVEELNLLVQDTSYRKQGNDFLFELEEEEEEEEDDDDDEGESSNFDFDMKILDRNGR